MLWHILSKEPDWKFHMRWQKPVACFEDQGCLDNACGETSSRDGCKCNNYHQERKIWEAQSFKEVGRAGTDWKYGHIVVLSNGVDLVHCSYTYGR